MARTKKTKGQRISEMLEQGKSIPEIVKAVKASPSMVYAIRAKMNKQETGIRTLAKPDTKQTYADTNAGIAGLRITPPTARAYSEPIKPVRQSWWRSMVNAIFGTRL